MDCKWAHAHKFVAKQNKTKQLQNAPTLMAKCQHREQNNCTQAAEKETRMAMLYNQVPSFGFSQPFS
jgi:hypothetical protein